MTLSRSGTTELLHAGQSFRISNSTYEFFHTGAQNLRKPLKEVVLYLDDKGIHTGQFNEPES